MKNENKRPLEGLKVVELTRAIVGPVTGRVLADCGAEVIHVESKRAIEPLRMMHPYKDDIPHVERSGYYSKYNVDKYGVTLNLTNPDGLALMRRLIARADVFVESNVPEVKVKYGLDYENVKNLRPDIIMLSSCQMGQRGPYAKFRAFGTQSAALAGFYGITGHPDQLPVGPVGSYTDLVSHQFLVATILAAVDYRRRTGKGQYLDHSQVEAGIQFLIPMVLDYTFNGRLAKLQGNRDNAACPHGCYPCKGDDLWCTIAVYTDDQWRSFCRVIGDPAWTGEDRFATFSNRKRHEDDIDRLVGEWTIGRSPGEVMDLMQTAGVPAGIVARGEDLVADPQLKWRGHFKELEHPEMGRVPYDELPFRFSDASCSVHKAAPCLGEDNDYVAREILGLSDDEYDELKQKGALD